MLSNKKYNKHYLPISLDVAELTINKLYRTHVCVIHTVYRATRFISS